jgi:hypothetical protein
MAGRHGWFTAAALAVACSGDDGTDPTGTDEPFADWACTQIATGEIVDVAASREEAGTIEVGRHAYRVNLLPGTAGFVGFSTAGAADLTLALDFAGAVPAWWNGDERVPLEPGEPNPGCDTDLPEVLTIPATGGAAWLEVGPVYQGAVWLALGE